MNEKEIEEQVKICEALANELIDKIEDINKSEADRAKANWKISTMMHTTSSMVLGPALAMARLNLSEEEYINFRAKVYQSVDAQCDEVFEAASKQIEAVDAQCEEVFEAASKQIEGTKG